MDLAGTPRFRYALLLREIDDMRTAEDFRSVGLVLIRLAGLEAVNANFGHIGGDRALEEFEQRLLALARQRGRVFRVGSTSFALLIHHPTNEGHAVLGAERISREAREPVLLGARRARLQAHMGVALLPELAGSTEALLRHCELALDESRDRDEPYIVYSDGLAAGSAGHASLAYLRDLPADELKIDRSFIKQMLTSDRDRRILASVIQLAHAVNMQVVAEGIEDGDAAQVLQDLGCEIGQGYFFNRPLPAGNFATKWLSECEAAEAGADA